ncbi:lipopolysaccharide biosynthesis protein [Streptomyces sp. NPDC050504]|uniref:lipopolysaccharide biosynthesis protein n=1 Tax=Streptomyces sp. NPDC050504 TaxID=3365618 RepID=UPI00378933F7
MNQESGPTQHRRTGGAARAWSRRAVWLLPGAIALGSLSGLVYGVVKAPQYAATSYVVVVPAEKGDASAALGFAQAYGRVAMDVAVTGDAAVAARVPVATLRAGVQAATSPDAPMISFTARSEDPGRAVEMADAVARAVVTNSSLTQGSTGVKVLNFSRATKPTEPVSPSVAVSVLVGGCAGGLLGGLGLLVRPRREPDEPYAAVPGPAQAGAVQAGAVQAQSAPAQTAPAQAPVRKASSQKEPV